MKPSCSPPPPPRVISKSLGTRIPQAQPFGGRPAPPVADLSVPGSKGPWCAPHPCCDPGVGTSPTEPPTQARHAGPAVGTGPGHV